MAFRSAAGSLRSGSRGLLLMLAGVALLTFMDGCMKALTQTYPVSQAIFFRSLLALPFLLLALCWDGGLTALRGARIGPQLVRGLFGFLTGLAFFHAVTRMPLADVLAVSFAAPFLIAALSGPLLGEAVGRRQWLAIGLGFLGVLVVLRPGGGVPAVGAAFALSAAFTYALSMIWLRKLGRTDAASVTTIWGTVVPLALNGTLAVPGWVPVATSDLPLLALTGLLGATGTLAVGRAFRLSPAAVLAPFDYTAMVWAVLIGVAFFGDVPGWPVILGSLVIVLSGLALARRR